MSSLENIISRLLNKDVEIFLETHHVTFCSGGETENLEPVVYLSAPPGSRRVLAVGRSSGLTEAFECISLFDGEPLRAADLKKHEILAAFFCYGLAKFCKRFALIRPRVIFYGTGTLAKVFGGYEQAVLVQAALAAGARQAIFK
jgi:hypothetical protein